MDEMMAINDEKNRIAGCCEALEAKLAKIEPLPNDNKPHIQQLQE
jgi:hypothetical protein